jgi:hypothetical protein
MRRMPMKKSICMICLMTMCLFASGLDIQKPTVVFDQGHGQKFLIEEAGPLHLSVLSDMFHDARFHVRAVTHAFSDETLKNADVLVISGPFTPFTPAEIESIVRFVEKGGRLCVMLHIGQPVAQLLGKFNVLTSNGVIREGENLINESGKDFFITRFAPHTLTNSLKQFAVHGGWALHVSDKHGEQKYGNEIAHTSQHSWIDLNRDGIFNTSDAKQSFGVIVAGTFGKGSFVVFGDDAVFQNSFLREYNMPLAKNLVTWLEGQGNRGQVSTFDIQ